LLRATLVDDSSQFWLGAGTVITAWATVNVMPTVWGERFTFGPGIASDDHLTHENVFAEMIAWLSFRPGLTADDAGHI
jgi:hypothetical protein